MQIKIDVPVLSLFWHLRTRIAEGLALHLNVSKPLSNIGKHALLLQRSH